MTFKKFKDKKQGRTIVEEEYKLLTFHEYEGYYEARRIKDNFLNANLSYNENLKIPYRDKAVLNGILEKLLGKLLDQKKSMKRQRDFYILIANIKELHKSDKKCISIPISANTWKKNFKIASPYTRDIINVLVEHKYLKKEKGFYNLSNHIYKKSHSTRIWTTEKIMDILLPKK